MNLKQYLTNREWKMILGNEFHEKYFKELEKTISKDKKVLCPHPSLIFRALNLTSYNNTKIVIIGQSPYHNKNEADGLAFSNKSLAPSLKNIFKEIESDLGIKNTNGDLNCFSNQGVLLINRVLTTEVDKVEGHNNIGWEKFTDKIISSLDNRSSPTVFIFWGKKSQELVTLVKGKHHLVLTAPHPSPFSARTGFFGCKHFSKANDFLSNNGKKIINWSTGPQGVSNAS